MFSQRPMETLGSRAGQTSPESCAKGSSITCSKSAELDPAATFAAGTALARRHWISVPILCGGQDAVKPGPTCPRLRRLRALCRLARRIPVPHSVIEHFSLPLYPSRSYLCHFYRVQLVASFHS